MSHGPARPARAARLAGSVAPSEVLAPARALADYYVRCVEGTATGVVEDARAPAAEAPG